MTDCYEIYYTYDMNFVTGNCPKGILKLSETYNSFEQVDEQFNNLLKERRKNAEYEFGWDKEYRLAIIKNNKIIKTDNKDNFWTTKI